MSILDGAYRVGRDHVVIEHEGHLRRAISIGVPRSRARFAIAPAPIAREREGDDAKRSLARPALPGCAHVVATNAHAVIVEAPAGVSLRDVIVEGEAHGGGLEIETVLGALVHATRAAAAIASAGEPAPWVDVASVRLGWHGELCMLGHLPGWPAPERDARHAWVSFQFMLARIGIPTTDAGIAHALGWISLEGTATPATWASAADRLAQTEVATRVPLDGARIRGLVRGLFPDAWRAAEALDEEIAMLDDADLKRVPSQLGRTRRA